MTFFSDDFSLSFHLESGTLCRVNELNINHLTEVVANENSATPFPWSQKNFETSLGSSHICMGVFVDDGTLISHAIFSLVSGEAELLNLAVKPEYQGMGVAKTFLQLMCSVLSSHAQEMFLEVRASNEGAIGLYETIGFNCLGERRNYYPGSLVGNAPREDALIYGINLSQ